MLPVSKQISIILVAIALSCPIASAQWRLTGFPPGKPVTALLETERYLYGANGDSNGFWRSEDEGAGWYRMFYPGIHGGYGGNLPGQFRVDALTSFGGILWAAGRYFGSDTLPPVAEMFGTMDDGANWYFYSANSGVRRFVSSDVGLFSLGTNGGIRWSNTPNFPDGKDISIGLSGSVAGVASLGSVTFTVTDTGLFVAQDERFRWQRVELDSTTPVYDIAMGQGQLYLATGQLRRSSDTGRTWQLLSLNSVVGVSSIERLTAKDNFVFAASRTLAGWRAFASSDHGDTWNEITDFLFNSGRVYFLYVGSHYLYAVSDDGLWRREIAGLSSVSVASPLSAEQASCTYDIANARLNIWYSISKPSHVHVALSDVLGRCLQTLKDDDEMEGGYRLGVPISDIGSGLRFVIFNLGNNRRVIPILGAR